MPLEKENFYGETRFICGTHLTVTLVGQRCIDLFVKLYYATLCYTIGAMLSTFYFCAIRAERIIYHRITRT